MQHDMHGMEHKDMPQMPHNINTVSWFSQEEDQKERHGQENMNWMQSKPEDSMGGHMQHGAGSTKGMSHGMSDTNEMNQMQHTGH
jgi:hypothetical protein